MLGILLIDKPQGLTSHDVVNAIRRKFGTKRVGHAGSLDPMATGALVVAVGPATRFLQYLPLEPKEYLADVKFGIETNTQDAEGDVVTERAVPEDLAARIAEALPTFLGPIEQLPPMYSAVKRDGKPLYAYAREGKEVERTPRTVYIQTYEPTSELVEAKMSFRVVCSGGTYVRTLGHDLGQALGCGAHLCGLRRTKVGRFLLEDAIQLDDAGLADIISLEDALPPMPIVALDEKRTHDIREGRALDDIYSGSDRLIALAEPNGSIFAVARMTGNRAQPECVIPAEAIPRAAL